ncbi:O-methyltransferase [Lojkania enalia]|uniref:O-methyltransferase n=1 Tax=Lojkania enalia TaxID=147567 RepID=A0A9P4KAC1_9PLEO|nr:O-methyltransferase [Didymosphaeria enalia]
MSSEAISIIDQLSALSKQPTFGSDTATQEHALYLTQLLSNKLRKPVDAAIELSFYPTFALAARLAVDLKLFNLITASPMPMSAAGLAAASGGPIKLIVRLLRPLAALGFVQEVAENTWTSTPITEAMSIPAIQAGHKHQWDQGNNVMAKMPMYFREKGFHQPEDATNGPFQYAFGTDKDPFSYWYEIPEALDVFNTFMTGNRGSRPSWVEWWPVEKEIFESMDDDENEVLLVDVGGGRGHDVHAFKNKFPDRKGRLVVEDLPAVIDDIKDLDERIERVKYDFLTPQPIKGARMYYFHFIMHDWSDDGCTKILSQIVPAMKKGYSKLLLSEFILPNQKCTLFKAGFDIEMMAMHCGQERTQNQWTTLLERVGLKVIKFWIPESGGEGIIEAELM